MSKPISDKSWFYGIGGWTYKFPCLVGNTHLARILKREAVKLRLDAVKLNATPDAPGSWIGGAPSNAELASGYNERAARYDIHANKVAAGKLEINCYQVATLDFDLLHRRACAVLADEVSTWTLQNNDCYSRVRLWLEFADLLYKVNVNDALDMLSTRHPWLHPDREMMEGYCCP